MTMAERNNKLKHLITCLKCEVRGKSCDVNCPTQYDAGNMGEIIENLEVISKALEQEPSGDAISKKSAKNAIYKVCLSEGNKDIFAKILDEINKLSSVNPQEPKTGHWSHDGSHWKNRFICSECGYKLFDEQTNYCPNCGARMVEPQESEVGNEKDTSIFN